MRAFTILCGVIKKKDARARERQPFPDLHDKQTDKVTLAGVFVHRPSEGAPLIHPNMDCDKSYGGRWRSCEWNLSLWESGLPNIATNQLRFRASPNSLSSARSSNGDHALRWRTTRLRLVVSTLGRLIGVINGADRISHSEKRAIPARYQRPVKLTGHQENRESESSFVEDNHI